VTDCIGKSSWLALDDCLNASRHAWFAGGCTSDVNDILFVRRRDNEKFFDTAQRAFCQHPVQQRPAPDRQ
jgi:hypothetical protein